MNTKVFLLLFLFPTICLGQKGFGEHDGYTWVAFNEASKNLFSEVDWQNKNEWINRIAKNYKLYYLIGIFDLYSILPGDNYRKINQAGKDVYYNVGHAYPYLDGLTPDQVCEGLDMFYKDYRNMNVLILDAIQIIQMEVKGKNENEIDWQTRYFRADEDGRSKMLKEKYSLQELSKKGKIK
jgi:hypothetical protein